MSERKLLPLAAAAVAAVLLAGCATATTSDSVTRSTPAPTPAEWEFLNDAPSTPSETYTGSYEQSLAGMHLTEQPNPTELPSGATHLASGIFDGIDVLLYKVPTEADYELFVHDLAADGIDETRLYRIYTSVVVVPTPEDIPAIDEFLRMALPA